MNDLVILLKARLDILMHQLSYLVTSAKLKSIVVLLAALGFWVSMFKVFQGGFVFVGKFPDLVDWLASYLLALFFFALTLMLVISNAIISYISLYKSKEGEFLGPLPIKTGNLFLYHLSGSLIFSSWAFLFLGTPLLFAYGVNRHAPGLFYPAVLVLCAIFIFLPAGLGTLAAMLLATCFPRSKKQALIGLGGLGLLCALVGLSQLIALRGVASPFTERWMYEILHKLAFCQNPLWPSYWITRGMIGSAQGDYGETIFLGLLILAHSLFLLLLGYQFARRWYFKSYSLVQSGREARTYPVWGLLDRLSPFILPFFKPPLRLMMIKDIKTFWRDPVQWSQFLIFFGLLGIYFLNLRNVPYINVRQTFWQYLVSFLNLTATTLTLATLTTRFIYPQLSLEGKRFWIIGVMPIKRATILYSKFIFAFLGALVVSETLIFISSRMLNTPWYMSFLQYYIVLIICLGLAALAVGLGVLYPNLKEDNPSKIVAGFGGTLNLLLSLIFILMIVGIIALPCHLYLILGRLDTVSFKYWLFIGTGTITLLGVIMTVVPLALGLKAIKRLEA